MESVVLNSLGFELTVASIQNFLSRFLKAGQLLSEDCTKRSNELEELFAEVCSCACLILNQKKKIELLSCVQYIAELTLQEYRFIQYTPSMIAASAVCLTHQVFQLEGTYAGF